MIDLLLILLIAAILLAGSQSAQKTLEDPEEKNALKKEKLMLERTLELAKIKQDLHLMQAIYDASDNLIKIEAKQKIISEQLDEISEWCYCFEQSNPYAAFEALDKLPSTAEFKKILQVCESLNNEVNTLYAESIEKINLIKTSLGETTSFCKKYEYQLKLLKQSARSLELKLKKFKALPVQNIINETKREAEKYEKHLKISYVIVISFCSISLIAFIIYCILH